MPKFLYVLNDPQSSAVERAAFCPSSGVIWVLFANGDRYYERKRILAETFQNLVNAPSVGRFVQDWFKGGARGGRKSKAGGLSHDEFTELEKKYTVVPVNRFQSLPPMPMAKSKRGRNRLVWMPHCADAVWF